MPIARRKLDASSVQASARTRKFVPDKNAVLHGFSDPKRAASIIYDETPTKQIPLDDLVSLVRTPSNNCDVERAYRNRIKGRLSAIRAFCVICQGGQPKRVRMCDSTTCPLWPFRMGSNPFFGKKALR